jgi:hypothetical protein
MVLGVAAGPALAIAVTIWLVRVPSSEPESRHANAALHSPGPSSVVPTSSGERRLALHPARPSPVVAASSWERRP